MSSSQRTKLLDEYKEVILKIDLTMNHLNEMSQLMLSTAQTLMEMKSELSSQFKNLKNMEIGENG